jgi:hypothetical protein
MRAFAQLPQATQQASVAKSAASGRGFPGKSADMASFRPAHDFSQISVYPKSPASVQTKLTVGAPGDRFEQEADRVAERVMSMPESRVQRACACESGEKDPKQDLLQAKGEGASPGTGVAPQAVHDVLGSAGQALDSGTKSFFEPRFGHDFSQVRLHTGQDAARAARSVSALAFTVGRDIVFGAGRYQPQTQAGRSLLAHELTHVMQQGGSQQTLMRACDCATIGGRKPDSTVPEEAGVASAFPGLVSGDWCVLKGPTPTYNCYAWSISDTTQWIDSQVDSVYGDKDGTLSFADFDAYYAKTEGFHPQSSPNSDTQVALFAKGSAPQHAARTADIQSCGAVPFTSKLGKGPLIAHDLYQLEGSLYGKVARYYG